MSTKPILGYYNLRGWAGPIRLLLAYLDVDYEDKLYTNPTPDENCDIQWKQEKDNLGLDFPNLPYWIDDSVKLTETKAILKHICRKYDVGLLGSTIKLRSQVNMLEEFIWDLWNSLTRACLSNTDELRTIFWNDTPRKLKQLSKFIGENNWSIGDEDDTETLFSSLRSLR